jgi:hypothetical protein
MKSMESKYDDKMEFFKKKIDKKEKEIAKMNKIHGKELKLIENS